METPTRPPERRTKDMLTTLATCPRRYKIEYEDNYRLKGRRPPPWPPNVKQILRDALRDRDIAVARGLNKFRVQAAANAVVMAYNNEYRRTLDTMNTREQDKWTDVVSKVIEDATQILDNYQYSIRDAGDFKFMLGSDGNPLVDRVVEHSLGQTGQTFAACVDGVLDRGQLGAAVLVRKFTSNPYPDVVAEDVELDQWLAAAMWSATKASDKIVTAAVVEIVRTKPPGIPSTVKCRQCSGTGNVQSKDENDTKPITCAGCGGSGIGGMSKKACDTTLEKWNATVKHSKLDLNAENERCASIVKRLEERGETFVYRVVVESSVQQIKQWTMDVDAMLGVEDHYRSARVWPRNGAACVSRFGACPYRNACSTPDGGTEMATFIKHNVLFPGIG